MEHWMESSLIELANRLDHMRASVMRFCQCITHSLLKSHNMGRLGSNLEKRSCGHEWIWKLDGGVHHRLLRPTFDAGQKLQRLKLHQMTRSWYQMKVGVMYITPVPTNSTLGFHRKRNQSLNFVVFNWNLM